MGNITSGATASSFPSHLYASQYSDVKQTISAHVKGTSDSSYSHPSGPLLPIVLSKDVSSQTDISFNNNHSVKTREKQLLSICGISTSLLIRWMIFSYVMIVFSMVFSPPLQSIIVYLNMLRWPLFDLTDLNRFGIDATTRNVNFTTEDGFLLRGYHMIPSHDTLSLLTLTSKLDTSYNSSNITSVQSFYDNQLANSERIVIYFHGNAGTRALHDRLEIIKKLSLYFSAHVITFDYRGLKIA